MTWKGKLYCIISSNYYPNISLEQHYIATACFLYLTTQQQFLVYSISTEYSYSYAHLINYSPHTTFSNLLSRFPKSKCHGSSLLKNALQKLHLITLFEELPITQAYVMLESQTYCFIEYNVVGYVESQCTHIVLWHNTLFMGKQFNQEKWKILKFQTKTELLPFFQQPFPSSFPLPFRLSFPLLRSPFLLRLRSPPRR